MTDKQFNKVSCEIANPNTLVIFDEVDKTILDEFLQVQPGTGGKVKFVSRCSLLKKYTQVIGFTASMDESVSQGIKHFCDEAVLLKIQPKLDIPSNELAKFRFYKEDQYKNYAIKQIFDKIKDQQSLVIIEPEVTKQIEKDYKEMFPG